MFWAGLHGAVDYALLFGSLHTRYGWHVHVDRDTNPRSLQNYLMQANGAEMMRIAACLATEQGLDINPIHDAFILTAPLEHLERDIAHLTGLYGRGGSGSAQRVRGAHICRAVPLPQPVHGRKARTRDVESREQAACPVSADA